MVSVELSITSNLMRRNPEALSLLSVLAELPAGARREFVQNLAPSLTDTNGAVGTLRQAALVQSHPSTHQIQLLSPIRSLILDKHRATSELRTSLLQAYFGLVRKYNSEPGDAIFLEAVKVLGAEAVNIETLLLDAVTNDPSDACIDAAYDYAEFQYATVPRLDIIENTVSKVRSSNRNVTLLLAGLRLQAKMYFMLSRYHDAVEVGSQAVALCKELGDQHSEAKSLRRLGDAYQMLGRYHEAMEAGKRAMEISQKTGDQRGEANSLLSLADAYRKLERYDEAVEVGKQAMLIFKKIGDQRGRANGLNGLARTYLMLGRSEDALKAGQQAMEIFKEIGALRGEAISLRILGRAYKSLGLQEEAMRVSREAFVLFQGMGLEDEVEDCRDLLRSLGVDS